MKYLAFVIFSLVGTAASFAQNLPTTAVDSCVEGSRSLTVYRNSEGRLQATFVGFDQTMKMDCTEKNERFKCTAGEYIADMGLAANGSKAVWLSLSGDFGLDSGFLYMLNCKN